MLAGSSTPRPRDGLLIEELDGELIVLERDSGDVHHLDPIATTIWHCFDGRSTVDAVVGVLARKFSTPRARVSADTVEVVERLLAIGVFELGEQ